MPKRLVVIATVFSLFTLVGWSSAYGNADQVVEEYNRLLSQAVGGEASDKVALFLYTAKHGNELDTYAETALSLLAEASEEGYGEASFWIGYMSENGYWMNQSDEGAMIFYVLSAQQGFDKGMRACVSFFSKAAVDADSEADREVALTNAQKWYDALSAIREKSPEEFALARFEYALMRIKINWQDEYGNTLLSEAALSGNEDAANLIRRVYAKASTLDPAGNEDAERKLDIWYSTIQKIDSENTVVQ